MAAPDDFWLFDQRKQREHPVAPGVRRRVLREVARMAAPGGLAEVLAASPAVRVLGEGALLGRHVVTVTSEASPSLSFSQHIGSQGRVGAALSCSFSNALRRLDTLSLEAKSHYGEGSSYEASWLFPFSPLPGHALALSARRGREALAEGLRATQHGMAVALRSRGAEERTVELGVATRQLEMDPLDFVGWHTAHARRSVTALALKYAQRVCGGPGAACNARASAEVLLFREQPPELKTQLTADWRVTALPLLALRYCALQHFTVLGLHCSLPGGLGVSPQHFTPFSALRGWLTGSCW